MELHPPIHVGLAALVGTPLAGAWLMQHNEMVLGRSNRRLPLMLLGLAGAAVSYIVWQGMHETQQWLAVTPVSGVAMFFLSQVTQGHQVMDRIRQGQGRSPMFVAGATGAFCLAVVLGGFHLFWTIADPTKMGHVVIRGQQKVFYEGKATEADAKLLGQFLAKTAYPGDPNPFFSGDNAVDVKIIRKGDERAWMVEFVLTPGAWERQAIADGYGAFGAMIKSQVFNGEPVEVHLVDDRWNTQKRINAP